MFLVTIEYLSRAFNVPPPKLKTEGDRVKELVKEPRVVAKRNISASGISEEYGELEQLIDSIIEKIDDKARTQADLKKVGRKERTRTTRCCG